MITYNHEKFIEQAVESVMMQETNFPYELVISDDCSPDRTREIVIAFQQKYPDRIRLLLPEQNLGAKQNWTRNLLACDGEFIAMLEGDDYWTSPHKLQRQVDFLAASPDCSACFTLTQVRSESHAASESFIPAKSVPARKFSTEDFLERNSIATCSLVLRNVMSELDLRPFASLKMGDWPMNILLSLRGPIGYLPELMAAYRQHAGGIWTQMQEVARLEAVLRLYEALLPVLPARFAPQITGRIIKSHQLVALEHLRQGQKRASFSSTWRSLLAIPWPNVTGYAWYLKRSAILFLGTLGMSPSGVERLLSK